MLNEDILLSEIFLISDIEIFTEDAKSYLLNQLKKNNFKLIIFIGDILSFLEEGIGVFELYDNQPATRLYFELFFDMDKIMKWNFDEFERAEYVQTELGKRISKFLDHHHGPQIKAFFSFAKECAKSNIQILYYSGNHDSMIGRGLEIDSKYISLFQRLYKLKNLHVPQQGLVRLNENLFLYGVHTQGNQAVKEYPSLDSTEIEIPFPEKTILISHLPGLEKFTYLGSEDISNFKKRFKFKYHFHGHCKDYNGEYLENGIPTRSVHVKQTF